MWDENDKFNEYGYLPSPLLMKDDIDELNHDFVDISNYRDRKINSPFPDAHPIIDDFDIIEDIARTNQLNPLYEQTLKELDEARLALSRAANKLATAVKLTDSEELKERTGEDFDDCLF